MTSLLLSGETGVVKLKFIFPLISLFKLVIPYTLPLIEIIP